MEEREYNERDERDDRHERHGRYDVNDYELMRRDEEEGLEEITGHPENGRWERRWKILNPWYVPVQVYESPLNRAEILQCT